MTNSPMIEILFTLHLPILLLLLLLMGEQHLCMSTIMTLAEESSSCVLDKKSQVVVNLPKLDLLPTLCMAREFNVTIKHHGCIPQTVSNKFCYGVCSSFFIPKVTMVTRMQDACAPTSMEPHHVTLMCPRKRKPGMRKKRVTIMKVRECGCSRI